VSRRADPARIAIARREAVVARLVGAGHGGERATQLVAAWLAELGRPPMRADWDAFDTWLDARSRRSPGS
jgi:hypothetical protein